MSNGTMRNKFSMNRTQGRSTYERINIRHVPPSRHAVFFRGFPSDIDINKLKDFLEDETQSNVGVDFSRINEQKKMCIAFRFESHDVARQILNKYNTIDLMGHQVDCTWFKDLKKARDRMIDEKRHYDDRIRSRHDYDRSDNRDYPNERRRPHMNSQNDTSYDRRDSSYKNARPSSDYERSPSKSSERSESNSEHEQLKSQQELKLLKSFEKPVDYDVDLDEEDINPISPKVFKENLETEKHIKHDGEDKKKKKKKRKRRKHEASDSDDSVEPPPLKSTKILLDDPETTINSVNTNVTSWKQPVSDSDDYIDDINQISKSKTFIHISSDKLNTDKNLKVMKQKIEHIEKAYKRDTETYSTVVSVLVRKCPDLKMRLDTVLKEVLIDLGNQCMDTMRENILEMSENPGDHNNDKKSQPLLSLDHSQSSINSSN